MTRPAAIRTLVKVGDEYAVVVDQPFLDALGITPDTPLDVRVEQGAVVVTSLDAKDARRRRIDEAIQKVNSRYSDAMRRLAEGRDDGSQSQ